MDKLAIEGGRPLNGTVAISGAKNAALPLMVAGLLTAEPLRLANLPHLADIATLSGLLAHHGVDLHFDGDAAASGHSGRVMVLQAREITQTTAPYDLVRKMRASVLVLGPLVARKGEARVSLPGGCAIGARPVDLHLKALAALGAEIALDEGYVVARAPKGGLVGGRVVFPMVSVGATENVLMAAALAKGRSVIENAAREPEVQDLCHCLNAMGARIGGIGGETLTVDGVDALHGADYTVLPDRIEMGTYAIAAAIAGGAVELTHGRPALIAALSELLRRAGVEVEEIDETRMSVRRVGAPLTAVDVATQPYPGFPTDLQAQIMAMLCVAQGAARVHETIFENRFMHVPELARMGADITVHGGQALVRGVPRLRGAPVMATDLRASSCLVLAGLAAEGRTVINRVYHLDRGYERIEEKLSLLGASIRRIRD